MTRLRQILLAGATIGLVFTLLTRETVKDIEEIRLDKFIQDIGSYTVDDKTRLIIDGEFVLRGGRFRMGNTSMIVKGDVTIGSGAEFIPSRGPLILQGTGHKLTIPATYSGSIVLTATGYTFYSILNVEPVPTTVIDRAIYSGSILLRDTGSHIEMIIPSLGKVIIQ